MSIEKFSKTIYLGDRGCKSIFIDCWAGVVKIEVTCISRVRDTHWNYHTDEDLENGKMVFTGVEKFTINPPGFIPNDLIDWKGCKPSENNLTEVVFFGTSADGKGDSIEIEIKILAKTLGLENSEGHTIDSSEN